MGIYKQKIDEKPSINTKGMVGVIANKSNVIIDNSYIEKGTAFLNAFENSNVIIKNCGTPKPIEETKENIVEKTKHKLTNEIDRKDLPFFIHHKIARFNNINLNMNDKNSSISRLEVINEYDDIDETFSKLRSFRNSINNNSHIENDEIVCDSKFLLEQQILRDDTMSSKDIDFTVSGLYYLSGLTSSIKAVFPLTKKFENNLDIPKINLNYVNREIFPLKRDDGNIVKIKNLDKLDGFGQTIKKIGSEVTEISEITKKMVVKTSVNTPIETQNFIKVENGLLNFNKYDETYYFDRGPYLNDLAYISYYKNDRLTKDKKLINDVKGRETGFYFKTGSLFGTSGLVFNLFDIINNIELFKSAESDSNISGYLWKYYFNDGKINLNTGTIELDEIIITNTGDYQPENIHETCNFYGFKFNNYKSTIDEKDKLFFFNDSHQDITSTILGLDTFKIIPPKLKDAFISTSNINSLNVPSLSSGFYISGSNEIGGNFINENIVINESIDCSLTGTLSCQTTSSLLKLSNIDMYFPITNDYGFKGLDKDTKNKILSNNYRFILEYDTAIKNNIISPCSSSLSFQYNLVRKNIDDNVYLSGSADLSKNYGDGLKNISGYQITSAYLSREQDDDDGPGYSQSSSTKFLYSLNFILRPIPSNMNGKYQFISYITENSNNEIKNVKIKDCYFSKGKTFLYENDVEDNLNGPPEYTIDQFLKFLYSGLTNSNYYINCKLLSDSVSGQNFASTSGLFASNEFNTLYFNYNTYDFSGASIDNVNDVTFKFNFKDEGMLKRFISSYNVFFKENQIKNGFDDNNNRIQLPPLTSKLNVHDFLVKDYLNTIGDGQTKYNISSLFSNYSILESLKSLFSFKISSMDHIFKIEDDRYTNFQDIFSSKDIFISGIMGYLVNGETPTSLPLTPLITGKRESRLDLDKATRYFKDQIYSKNQGSTIDSYTNIYGIIKDLINTLIISEEYKNILYLDISKDDNGKQISSWVEFDSINSEGNIISESSRTIEIQDSKSMHYSSKVDYESNYDNLISSMSGSLKNELLLKYNNNNKVNDVLSPSINDFDFNIIDVEYEKNKSLYAYFGFSIKYKMDYHYDHGLSTDTISFSIDNKEVKGKQTISFKNLYKSSINLPNNSYLSIYDYLSALYLSGKIMTLKDEFKDKIDENTSITNDFDKFEKTVELSDYYEEYNISEALQFNYNNQYVYFNGNDTISIVNPSGLFLIDEKDNIISPNISSELYVYPGLKLTKNMIKNDNFDEINKSFNLIYNPSGELIAGCAGNFELIIGGNTIDPIILCFDKECKQTFEFDADDKSLYKHNIDGLKIYENEKISSSENGIILKYNYQKLHEFEFLKVTDNELANFNDWYNVDTYINYDNLNNNNEREYSLNIKNSDNTLKNRDVRFSSDSFKLNSIDDFSSLEITSNIISSETEIVKGNRTYGVTYINDFDNNFKSLFTERPSKISSYQGYKMFSFNFLIPSAGWGELDEIMYQENPYWMNNIVTNNDYLSEDIVFPSSMIDLTKRSLKGDLTFEGNFLLGISVFNRRYEFTSFRTDFKTYKRTVIPLYMKTKDGKICDAKTGKQTKTKINTKNVKKLDLIGFYNIRMPNDTIEKGMNVSGSITQNGNIYPVYSHLNLSKCYWTTSNSSERIYPYPVSDLSSSWTEMSGIFEDFTSEINLTDNINGIVSDGEYTDGKFKAHTDEEKTDILGLDSYDHYFTSCRWNASLKSPKYGSDGDTRILSLVSNNNSFMFSMELKRNHNKTFFDGTGTIYGSMFSFTTDKSDKEIKILLPEIRVYAEYDVEASTILLTTIGKSIAKNYNSIFSIPSNMVSSTFVNSGFIEDEMSVIPKTSLFYKDLVRNNNGKEFSNYGLTNISNEKSVNNDGYPLIWMNFGNFGFSKKNGFNDKIHNQGISYNDSKFSVGQITSHKGIYDLERFVKPFDMSTNLFYYKSSNEELTDDITNDDEVVIINARKMYNQVPDEVPKPVGGSINLDLGQLSNQNFILTGYIPLDPSNDALSEVYLYRNDRYEYAYSDVYEIESSGIYDRYAGIDDNGMLIDRGSKDAKGWIEVRYTDYLNSADQWKLFKLNNSVVFSTTNDFKVKISPANGMNNVDNVNENDIELPCKLKMTFNNLIFKEKIRTGVSFDNISDITFNSRIIPQSMISDDAYAKLSGDPMSGYSGWKLRRIGNNNDNYGSTKLYGVTINSKNELEKVDASDNENYNQFGYISEYYIDQNTHPSSLFGGPGYYNDVTNLKVISNSVNQWSTSNEGFKFEKIKVFSDYCPINNPSGVLIGTPYCNLSGTQFIIETVDELSNMGGNSVLAGEFLELGGVIKIATDFKYINNIKQVSKLENIKDYPNSERNIINLIVTMNPEVFVYGKNRKISCKVSGKLADISITGKYECVFYGIDDFYQNNSTKFSIYINFDGLLYEKEVELANNSEIVSILENNYNVVGIINSTISVNNDGTFDGEIEFEIVPSDDINKNLIEIHNVKLPCPTINSIGISYNDGYENILDKNGYIVIDDEVWQKKIALKSNNANLEKILDSENIIFTLQDTHELRSNIEIDYDENNKPRGIFVELTVPGLNKFSKSTTRYFLENQQNVKITDQKMLENYQHLAQANLDNYIPCATIGTTVLSGSLNFEYNKLNVEPLTGIIKNIGNLKYVYNPLGKYDFQLEVITKQSNEPFKKKLFYINKSVNKWYNMSIYRWDKQDEMGNFTTSNIGLILDEIPSDDIGDLSSKGHEIFNCTVSNDLIIEGSDVYTDETNFGEFRSKLGLNDNDTSLMSNYKSNVNVEFDPCSRTPWETFFTKDMSNVISNFGKTDYSDLDYLNRKGADLYNIGEFSFNNLKFYGKNSIIKIFANEELHHTLNDGISETLSAKIDTNLIKAGPASNRPYFINYASCVGGQVSGNTDYHSSNPALNNGNDQNSSSQEIRNYLNRTIPRKIMLNDSENNYILVKKDFEYHITPVAGMEVKNIMFVSSPNFSIFDDKNVKYVDNYNDSLDMVNKYIDYFNNPQNRLPAVKYKNHILNSDFATFIYNSCSKYKASNVDDVENQLDKLMYNYDNVPDVIANIWSNSQVTRNESIFNGQTLTSRLYWTKSSSNEFISEVGSIYNYQNSTYMTNIVKIETGSINERQTVLMPVLTEPFEFEKRSAQSGLVKVNEQIIATAALGYNSIGYPINSILQYNSNGSVNIDTSQTNYFYISQKENIDNCYFGATQQKPVYVESIQQNTQSLSEKFKFLPNPSISENLTGEDVDQYLIEYYGGNFDEFNSNSANDELFLLPSVQEGTYYYPSGISLSTIDICYSCVNVLKEHSVYYYESDDITNTIAGNVVNYAKNNTNGKFVTFIGNLLSFSVQGLNHIRKDSLNVFYNESDFEKLLEDLNGISIESSFESMNCYGYDGLLIPQSLWHESISKFADNEEYLSGSYNLIKTKLENYSSLFQYQYEIDMEPSIGVIWKNIDNVGNYLTYFNKINSKISEDLSNRHAIFDEYYSTNITGFKIKIKNEHLQSAPVYIKVSLLKIINSSDGTGKFAWWNDPILDLNLTDTYENIYDYSTGTDKEIEKMFVNHPDKDHLIKNSYGIKFTIKQIVPQQTSNNKCIIDNIEIYTSNILNNHGIGSSVEDVFVRKADANCRHSYQMDVNEYIWRMPTTKSEWKTLNDIFTSDTNSGNYELIDDDSYKVISGVLTNMGNANKTLINDQILNNDSFSYMSTYYFTNSNSTSNKISEVLSDNYLVNSNIKISWKYVDYVYISYSCYSPNSMDLLNAFFGKKIYNAVKAKLLSNINNMNSNSAFTNRYKFTGGIAKSKEEKIDINTNSGVFQWKTDVKEDQWNRYRNCYTSVGQSSESYATEVYKTTTKRKTFVNGRHTATKTSSRKSYKKVTTDHGTSTTLANTKVEHLGNTTITDTSTLLENVTYSSVPDWIRTFVPIAIKFKIN